MANSDPKTEHLVPFQFKEGESGNPNGRPRKLVSKVIDQLGKNGIENVTREQVVGAIEVLLNCTEEEIKQLAKDEGQSALIRILCSHIGRSGTKGSEKVFNMLLDRAFGKPDQKLTANLDYSSVYPDPVDTEDKDV